MRDKMIRLAREGAPPKTAEEARARNSVESNWRWASTSPFWRLDAVPQTAAIRFIIAETDDKLDNMIHARAAARELKGPTDVQVLARRAALADARRRRRRRQGWLPEWMKQRL